MNGEFSGDKVPHRFLVCGVGESGNLRNGEFSGEKYRMGFWNTEFGNLGNLGNGGFSGESEAWGIFWGIRGMGNSESGDFLGNPRHGEFGE